MLPLAKECGGYQKVEGARMRTPLYEFQRKHGPAYTLILDF